MKLKIHFMGIGGSGMSGVALIARKQGYQINGCDLNIETPYINKLKKLGTPILSGHDSNHVKDADIIAVSPAVFFQSTDHPEVLEAKKQKKIMTWQKFLGEHLQKGKKVISIAGTHGKSTTTAMAALLFEKAGFDPNVMIGATVKEWEANYRVGKGDIFITESDEFYDNFLNYHPDVIILNNIEFDHPDFFKDENQMFESFRKFVGNLKGDKILIFNEDSLGVKKLFDLIGSKKLSKINLYGYSLEDKNADFGKSETNFDFDGERFTLKVPGEYNISNALGVIILGKLFNIPTRKIKESLLEYDGVGRRLELIGEKRGIKVYDDYAHHPTAIKATLEALRQKYPKEKITAIIEPHTFSRTKALLSLYKNAFEDADQVIIAPIFKSRDASDFGISGNSIVDASNHENIEYLGDFEKITTLVEESARRGDIIIVMGAGKSYELARNILNSL